MSNGIVICDIDGTLSDHSMRIHLAKRKEWSQYHEMLEFDPPKWAMVLILRSLSQHADIHLVTGRPERYRKPTEAWLKTYMVPYQELIMRPSNVTVSSSELKKQYILSIGPRSADVVVAFEDRDEDVAAYRSLGIYTHQVNYGDF